LTRDHRRLAAIVSADVVGYSLLMGRDDSATLAGLKAHQRELIDPKIAEYGGRIVKASGDGLLLEFPSVVDAVRCAVEVQRGMAERNAGVSPEQRIEFRIGINVGDIIIDGEDIFGDGVNVAARLQTLAEPGGICISRAVRDQVFDKLSFAFRPLGARELKNIARPVEVYRIELETATVAVSAPPTPLPTHTAIDDHMPSIAVLPFVNLSDDVAIEYFADGLAEELLSVLSRIRGLRVVSRTSSFYFKGKDVDLATVARKLNVATILEGSVRKSGKRLRIAVQLIHIPTDSHMWSRTYDRKLEDVFAVQDEIAQSIVVELRLGLRNPTNGAKASGYEIAEVADASRGRTANGEALRQFLQGRFFAARQASRDITKALEYYERALALDPEYASAWVAVASAHASLAGYGGDVAVADRFRRARAAAQRALALEPNLPAAHSILSWIQLYCDWDWKGADASSQRALELAPNDTQVLQNAAIVASNLGQDKKADALIRRASLLDPLDATIHRQIAMAELDAMNLDAAEAALSRALEFNPQLALTNFTFGLICLARRRETEALVSFQRETLEDYRLLGATLAQHAQGLDAESTATLEELVEKYAALSPCQIAEAHACRGEMERAFEWLDRAYAGRDPRLVEIRGDSLLSNLHSDSRWRPFLEKMGFDD
jgi:adenylate cyclase